MFTRVTTHCDLLFQLCPQHFCLILSLGFHPKPWWNIKQYLLLNLRSSDGPQSCAKESTGGVRPDKSKGIRYRNAERRDKIVEKGDKIGEKTYCHRFGTRSEIVAWRQPTVLMSIDKQPRLADKQPPARYKQSCACTRSSGIGIYVIILLWFW